MMPRCYFDIRENDTLAVDEEDWSFLIFGPLRSKPPLRWDIWLATRYRERSGITWLIEVRTAQDGGVFKATFLFETARLLQ
jgi:hypothetical protein